jgi:ABC-2 type transport system permease protein
MFALAHLTFREALAKKTFIAFALCSTVFLLLLTFALQVDVVQGGEAALSIIGNDLKTVDRPTVEITEMVNGILMGASIGLLTAGLFLSIFATAGLVPSMLEKGSVDLLLSKPLNRTQLLFGRSLGALGIVFVNIAYLILGIWVVLGFKTGFWIFNTLWIIPLICLIFFIVYAWMTLWGVVLRNSALTIMLTYILFGLSSVLLLRDQIYAFLSSKIWGYLLDGIFYTLPRISEMITQSSYVFMEEKPFDFIPFLNSLGVGIIIYAFAIYLFKKKDF